MKAEYQKHLTLRMSPETKSRLKARADELEVSVSDLVRSIIEDRLGE